MRKARGSLWWYRLRYDAPAWLLPSLLIVTAIFGYQVERIHQFLLTAPACRKVADAPSGLQAQRMDPVDGWRWQRISRCREGWTNVGAHGAHEDAGRRQNGS